MKSLSLNQPHVIIMVGIPGSGKTFFAEKFASTFHAPYVSREKIETFTTDSKAVSALFSYQLGELLKTQQSVIVEGSGDTHAERIELARKAKANGYEPLFVWVQTDPTTAKNRVIKENKSITPEKYDRLLKRFTAPTSLEKPLVISGKHTYATQAKIILKKLSAPRTEEVTTHTSAPARPAETTAPRRRNITIR